MLCYEFPPIGGGGAKVVDGLTRELSRKGIEVHLITMNFRKLPAFEQKDNLHIHRIKCLRLKESICTFPEMITYIISALPTIIKLQRNHKFHINHTHFIFPDGILAYLVLKLTGLKYILTAHGSDVPGYNTNRFKIFHKILKPLWKKVVRYSNQMVFPSKNLYELFRRVDKKTEGIIIPNGINLDKFSPLKEKQKEILVVTRMFERKGVQYILKALEGLEHDYKINIVGEGPYLESLKRLAIESKLDVNFLGFIDNHSDQLKKLYEESSIFIFTSESENFPIVLLEAMVARLAIITTRNTGCAEVVGDSALLIDSKDSSAVRNALIELINNPQLAEKLRQSSRKRVEELFGWQSVANQYVKVYESFISK